MENLNIDGAGDKEQDGILLKGGFVVNAAEYVCVMDVLINGEKIRKVGQDIIVKPDDKIKVIDCSNKYVLPGGIDLDTQGARDQLKADDYADLSAEALKGGTTVIATHITTDESNPSLVSAYLAAKQSMESSSCCHVIILACLRIFNETVANEIRSLVREYGVTTFKVNLSDKDTILTDLDLYNICILIKQLSSVLFVKCGNGQLPETFMNKSRADEINTELIYASMYRMSAICKATNCPVVFIDLSDHFYEKAVSLKNELLMVSGNTTDLDCEDPDPWAKLGNGGIYFMTSGPHGLTKEQQQQCVKDRMKFTWENTVECGVLSSIEFVNLVSANPARLLNMYPKRGCIKKNSQADIVVWSSPDKTELVLLNGRTVLDNAGNFKRWPLDECKLRIESGSEELYAKVSQRDQALNYSKPPVTRKLEKMTRTPLRNMTSKEKDDSPSITGRRSLQRCGGRNLQESSFSLSGAQRDDSTPSRSSIRTNQPPGGKSSALW